MRVNNLSILITRPVNESLLNKMKLKGFDVDIIPFIETKIIRTKEVETEIENVLKLNTAVVFTSMNAVDAVAEHLQTTKPNWKIYCIGNTTKILIEKYFGSASIAATADDATALAKKIIANNEKAEVYFFCGDKKRNELPGLLKKNKITLNEIEVYTTSIIQHTIEKNYDAVLFFSPSAVDGFFKNNSVKQEAVLFAIGNTTADEIKKFASNKIIVSDKPGKENLVEKTVSFFEI